MHPTEANIKQKNQSPMRIIVNRWGFLLGFLMLGLGVAMGLLAAIFVGPQLLGFDVTATALMEREIVLVATQVELDTQAQDALARATGFALDIQATQAILNNNADLLDQTATQSAQHIIATNTASAVQNVQHRTQVANDFVATQAALNANATQVDIDFRNTQTALGIENSDSQISLEEVQAAATALGTYIFDMSEVELDSNKWQIPNESDWQVGNTGRIAINDGAILIGNILPNYFWFYGSEDDYTIEATIIPATVVDADYWILFSMTEESGLAAYFHADTLNITEVGLYRFELSQLDGLLTVDELSGVQDDADAVSLSGQTQLSVTVEGEIVTLSIGDEVLLQSSNVPVESGAIGVQLPAQSTLLSIEVSED